MSALELDEKCHCGASFRVSAEYSRDAIEQVREWRRIHQHPPLPETPATPGDTK